MVQDPIRNGNVCLRLSLHPFADQRISCFFVDMRTCDCLIGWHAHSTDILDVQFSTDETSLFSLGADGKVWIDLFHYDHHNHHDHDHHNHGQHYRKSSPSLPSSSLSASPS